MGPKYPLNVCIRAKVSRRVLFRKVNLLAFVFWTLRLKTFSAVRTESDSDASRTAQKLLCDSWTPQAVLLTKDSEDATVGAAEYFANEVIDLVNSHNRLYINIYITFLSSIQIEKGKPVVFIMLFWTLGIALWNFCNRKKKSLNQMSISQNRSFLFFIQFYFIQQRKRLSE
jgi:hypothetical protein